MNRSQRLLWSDKLMDLANFSVVGLVFGAVIEAKNISEIRWQLIIIGLIIYLVLAFMAHKLRR